MRTLAGIAVVLIVIALTASRTHADHERFIVGEMRNVDPSAEIITSISGACVPSHDREKLDCYFTSFGLWKSQTEEQLKKEFEGLVQELNKDPAKQLQEMKKAFCSDKKITQPDPLRLKYNVWAKAYFTSIKAFCERPSRDAALAFFRTMMEADAKKCRCVVSDWRSTLMRQVDRWVENSGPSGLCGIIKVFTLVPYELKKMKDATGPILWTLHEKTVTTHSADDKLCGGKSLLKIEDGTMSFSWNAASKSIDCGEIEFSSALEGQSDPRRR